MAKKKNNNKKKVTAKDTKKEKNVVEVQEVKKDIPVKKEKVEKKDTKVKETSTPKKNLWVRFRIFLHGVRVETKKIHWTSKEQLIKYSIATIVFVVFMALFFYGIDAVFAAVQSLFK